MDRVLLGTDINNEKIYLTKHKWSCSWYWSFGHIGNDNMSIHFNSEYLNNYTNDITRIFKTTKITQNDWWILLELFSQAYALSEAYEVFYRGGLHIFTTNKGVKKDRELATRLAKDLEDILDTIYKIVKAVNNGK